MTLDLIPEAHRPAVRRALAAAFGTEAVESLTPMAEGMSGALVCRVAAAGQVGLLRVTRQRDTLRDPARQFACVRIAAEAGLTPPVLYADADDGVSITGFVEARPLMAYPGGPPAMVMELGRMIRRLQAAPVFPPLVDFFDGLDSVVDNVLSLGVLSPEAARGPLAGWAAIKAAYPRLPPQAWVSSHNDLNPSNLVQDGQRLWIVDWEAAFAADPHVDPANLANWFGLSGEAETAFFTAVFGDLDEERLARLAIMRRVSDLFVGSLMLGLAAAGGAAPVDSLDGPPLAEVRMGLITGAVQLNTTAGQLAMARARLREVAAFPESDAFSSARRVLAASAGMGASPSP